MIVPFVMSLLTINERPYLWFFYKMMDMSKRFNGPMIAQEKYFVKPSEMAQKIPNFNKRYEDICRRNECDFPTDDDYEKIGKYVIPEAMEKALVTQRKSYNNAMAYVQAESWKELEDLLDKYFTDIEKKYNEKIDAVITLCYYPALQNAAEKHNIKVINFELGLFRHPCYLKTAYYSYTDLYNNDSEQEERFRNFTEDFKASDFPLLSRKEILAVFLTDQYLYYLSQTERRPDYEIGVALGYATWIINLRYTFYNDEELMFRIKQKYESGSFLVRKHPGDPAKAQYPAYIEAEDKSPNTIEFILKCKGIASLCSNVSMEAAFWGRRSYAMLGAPASYMQMHDLDDDSESFSDAYLNYFAFCYLIPYNLLTDTEYLTWRLSGPSEKDIFFRHLKEYLSQKNIPFEEFCSVSEEKRFDYLLSAQGTDMATLAGAFPASNLIKGFEPSLDKLKKTNKGLSAENIALKRENAQLQYQLQSIEKMYSAFGKKKNGSLNSASADKVSLLRRIYRAVKRRIFRK